MFKCPLLLVLLFPWITVSIHAAEQTTGTSQNKDVLFRVTHKANSHASHENTLFCPLGPTQLLQTLAHSTESPEVLLEIEGFLGANLPHSSLAQFSQALRKAENSGLFTNRQYLLASDRYSLRSSHEANFKDLSISMEKVDYRNRSAAVDRINGHVKEDTHNHIDSIVTANDITSDTALTLLSTLYVEAKWKKSGGSDKFRREKINFTGLNGNVKSAINAFGNKAYLSYRKDNSVRQVLLEAENNIFLFAHLNESNKLEPVTKELFDNFLAHECNGTVRFKMPTFEVENSVDLKETLRAHFPKLLGGHEFTLNLFDQEPKVSVGAFRQKNKLQVTQSGVIGASVTVIIMATMASGNIPPTPPALHFDKPFTYALYLKVDNNNYVPLFTGQVVDPIAPHDAEDH